MKRNNYIKHHLLKRILASCIALVFFSTMSYAHSTYFKIEQDTTYNQLFVKPRKNIIKFGCVQLLNNSINVSLQRYLSNRISVDITGFGFGILKNDQLVSNSGVGGEITIRRDMLQKNIKIDDGYHIMKNLFVQLSFGYRSISEASQFTGGSSNTLVNELSNRDYGYGGGGLGWNFMRNRFYLELVGEAFIVSGTFEKITTTSEFTTFDTSPNFSDGALIGKSGIAGRMSINMGLMF